MKFALLAAAAVLAAPAVFAQTTIAIPEDATAIVAPGRTITPGNSPVSGRPIPGAVIAEERGAVQVIAPDGSSSSTATMGAGPAPAIATGGTCPKASRTAPTSAATAACSKASLG
ncbi:hypothetical protein HK414_21755 [Ramlibacter terrae]|uniref:DUF4148 domain-containing protein n=1 Tax=Ramlibacter terrae TaxID=2732511 RepID=A0ABX6P4V2_9BURK|nr:hypothetical protein HK414_21755 [Ramlibacter terrae]